MSALFKSLRSLMDKAGLFRNSDFQPIFVEMFYNKNDAQRREGYLKSSKGKFTLKAMLKETVKNNISP